MLKPPVDRLRPLLTELLLLECAIAGHAGRFRQPAAQRAKATALLTELESLAVRHADALKVRMRGAPISLGEGPGDWDPAPPAPSAGLAEAHPVSAAVRDAYVLVQHAAIAYAALVPISNRLRDSWVMADEGTTSHIGRQHMQDYLAIAGRLLTLMHTLLIDELEADGVVCGCTCPVLQHRSLRLRPGIIWRVSRGSAGGAPFTRSRGLSGASTAARISSRCGWPAPR
jgi:hypothetical protein